MDRFISQGPALDEKYVGKIINCHKMSETDVMDFIGRSSNIFNFPTDFLRQESDMISAFEKMTYCPKNVIFEDADVLVKTSGWKWLKANASKLNYHSFWIPNETSIELDKFDIMIVGKDKKKINQDIFLSHEAVMELLLSSSRPLRWDYYLHALSEPGNALGILHENSTDLKDISEISRIQALISECDVISNSTIPHEVSSVTGILMTCYIIDGRLKAPLKKATAWSKGFNMKFREKRLSGISADFEYLDYFAKFPSKIVEFCKNPNCLETLLNAKFAPKHDKKELKRIIAEIKKRNG